MNKVEKIRKEAQQVLLEGQDLAIAWALKYNREAIPANLPDAFKDRAKRINIHNDYQQWYSKSLQLIGTLLPCRKEDFLCLYEYKGNRKKLDYSNYRIADALRGYAPAGDDCDEMMRYCFGLVEQQRSILNSAIERLDSSLYDIEKILQADLFDSEIAAAKELNKKGFARAAGAMAGVVLEKHFEMVIKAHALTLGKKNPCINDYNQKLKDEGVLDIPTWRFVQRLGDLRNLCDHNKGVDPKKEDIDELIAGVDKIMKTVS